MARRTSSAIATPSCSARSRSRSNCLSVIYTLVLLIAVLPGSLLTYVIYQCILSIEEIVHQRQESVLIYEYKLAGTKGQYAAIDEAIRTTQFIRNKCVRLWMDTRGTNRNALQCCCAVLAKEFPFAAQLNSQARQAAADRAWSAISRFYENCQKHKPGKKGYPQFQHDNRSVEYKQTGWQLEPDGKHVTFTDGCGIGRLRLVGNKKQQIETFPTNQIRRARLVKRADGYYCQFAVEAKRRIEHLPTGISVGIDMGLTAFLTDSDGTSVVNPRHLRKAEKRLRKLHRRLSHKQRRSANHKKARKALAKGYLQVVRQREDFARKTASTLITSHDLIAYEHLKIANLVKNRRLAKSISDAAWGRFLSWLRYYGQVHEIPVIAVEPAFTSQDCSACGTRVQKSLSVRTHVCSGCGLVLDRDHNAARNILAKALDRTGGQSGTGTPESVQNASGQTTATRRSTRATSK
jgi:putative transposase